MLPGSLLVLTMLTSLLFLSWDRSELRFTDLSCGLLGRVPACILGALTANALNLREFLIFSAALVLVAFALSLPERRIAPSRGSLCLAATASG